MIFGISSRKLWRSLVCLAVAWTALVALVEAPSWQRMGGDGQVAQFVGHLFLWGLGLVVLALSFRRLDSAIRRQNLAERSLEESHRSLESRVADRTAEHEAFNEQLQREIDERKRMQEKLADAVTHWRETVDVMSDFVSVQDSEMRFVRVNKTLAGFFGMRPEQILGKHCYEFMHKTCEPWPGCPHVKAIERGERVSEVIEEPHLGRTLLVTCSPIFDGSGKPKGTVHVARDISDQKRAEKEREALVRRLQTALDENKILRGILPMCSYCKRIRDDAGHWERVDNYIHRHSSADISHGICPDCLKERHPVEYQRIYSLGDDGRSSVGPL